MPPTGISNAIYRTVGKLTYPPPHLSAVGGKLPLFVGENFVLLKIPDLENISILNRQFLDRGAEHTNLKRFFVFLHVLENELREMR